MPLLRAFIVCIALVFCATWSAPAWAGISSTTPPDALLTSVPVHALAGQPDPNIVIDLSIKASNAGPAYLGGFEPAKVYEGYWDAKGCYDYLRVEGYFRRTATATTLAGGEIACRGQWSGNLLNWATASPLDQLRMALTGGDRVVDTPERTVLQRATWPIGAGVELSVKTVRGHLERLTPRSGLRADETLRIRNCGERLVVDADMRADADRGCVSAAGADLYFARRGLRRRRGRRAPRSLRRLSQRASQTRGRLAGPCGRRAFRGVRLPAWQRSQAPGRCAARSDEIHRAGRPMPRSTGSRTRGLNGMRAPACSATTLRAPRRVSSRR